jgi:prephenate dehydratase/chorismate mutase/prephenate dehydratase
MLGGWGNLDHTSGEPGVDRPATGPAEPGTDQPDSAGLVTYLGPEGTFTHAAAMAMWPGQGGLKPVRTVPEAVSSVLDGVAGYTVIPVENTIEGIVTASIDQLVFRTGQLVIWRETSVRISFNAYRSARPGGPPAAVASHPHGLAQCQRYIVSVGLPSETFASTAAAVEAAARDPRLVAIGAPGLETGYDVTVLREGVEDHPGAYTRFACVGRLAAGPGPAPAASELTWKTTLALTPGSSRPGVLAELCTHFADHGMNIISLASRPLPGFAGAYVFVVALDCSRNSVSLARSVLSMIYSGIRVKYLGSYRSDYLVRSASRDRPLIPPAGSYGVRDIDALLRLLPGSGRAGPPPE